MGNLTVVIDDNLLKRARMRALDQGTSVNAVVREQLERYAGDDDAIRHAMKAFLTIAQNADAGSGPGGRSWTRDELHDR